VRQILLRFDDKAFLFFSASCRADGAGLGDTDDTKTAGSDIGTIRKERMVARPKLNSYGEFRCARPVCSPLPPL
jgi:hypothetical protein